MKIQNYFICFILLYTALSARDIHTPLILTRGPLNKLYTDITSCPWKVNVWAGGYERSASQAFDCKGRKVPLSTLFFNKATFNPQEAFAFNTAESPINPLLATSILGPRVAYKESGAQLGIDLQTYLNDCWRIGFRASLPARKIRIRRLKSNGNGDSDLGGQTLRPGSTNFFGERTETVNGTTIKSYAFRLDFISRLPYTCDPCPGQNILIVNYKDSDFPPNNPITISNQDITNQEGTPVSALKSNNGTLPGGTWAFPEVQAQMLPIINNEGTNIPNNGRGRFDATVMYNDLGANKTNQSMFFIVPSVDTTNTTPSARVIQQHVNELLACIDQEAEEVFKRCGNSFAPQCNSGAGDLDTEFFTGHFFSPCTYAEGYLGIKWPTGKRSKNPLCIFKEPLGNNGHYEFKIGAQGLWQPCNWAAVKGDVTYSVVTRSRERVATAFTQANIKNIGLPVVADISWNYYILHADLILIPPCSYSIGLDLGYELYHKTKDRLTFCKSTALDCLGMRKVLDETVLTRTTRVVSHTFRGELFGSYCGWAQLYGGGSTVFSGTNAPKETEWHLGITCYY